MADLKQTLQRFYDEVFGQGNVDAIDELVADDFVEHEVFPGLGSDRQAVKDFTTMMRTAFPDLTMEVHDLIVEDDKAVARISIKGTHQGEFMGIPPTGKAIDVPTVDIVRFEGDKAAEHWGVTDGMVMMQQLGVTPEEPPAG